MGKRKKSEKSARRTRSEERKEQIMLQKSALSKIVDNLHLSYDSTETYETTENLVDKNNKS